MRVKELEQHLSQLKGFGKPKIIYEQYATDAHLASRMLHVAHTSFDDIEGKTVLDLGCGCGMLSIGAMMLGSAANVGIDIDPDALEIFRENMDTVFDEDEMPTVDLINADVVKLAENWPTGSSFMRPQTKFDTVLLNPPFGTKSNAGIDMLFLQQAVTMSSGAVYSMHKSSTREYILRKAKEAWGVAGVEVIAQLKFDLPATYKFHKKEKVTIEVDLIRLQINP